MAHAPTTSPRRRRRSPEEAEREIIDAAEAMLRERPFRELTVDEVMQRTGLSRPSFYVYFRDRHHLVLEVVQRIQTELFAMSDLWYGGADGGADLAHRALEGVVAVYQRHGPVLRALADAATDDPDVERTYGSLVQAFVEATTQHMDAEIAAGRIRGLDARQTATALILMSERYLALTLGRTEPSVPPKTVTETLAAVWTRTLYPAA
jgi:TetR/AcrR family transcriptional regulator, ethionamide resistance regulator